MLSHKLPYLKAEDRKRAILYVSLGGQGSTLLCLSYNLYYTNKSFHISFSGVPTHKILNPILNVTCHPISQVYVTAIYVMLTQLGKCTHRIVLVCLLCYGLQVHIL